MAKHEFIQARSAYSFAILTSSAGAGVYTRLNHQKKALVLFFSAKIQ